MLGHAQRRPSPFRSAFGALLPACLSCPFALWAPLHLGHSGISVWLKGACPSPLTVGPLSFPVPGKNQFLHFQGVKL